MASDIFKGTSYFPNSFLFLPLTSSVTTLRKKDRKVFKSYNYYLSIFFSEFSNMNLFHSNIKSNNLLPHDGEVYYYGVIFTSDQSKNFMDKLFHTIEWKNDEAILFGKHITTKRKVAWYGDSKYSYTYSKTTKDALPWTLDLLEIKSYMEKLLQQNFNSCLLNLYHNGEEGMAYHSDDEKSLEKNGIIASVSFGAERKFSFRHKRTKETIQFYLEAGSLLTMGGLTQTNWLHSLPTSQKIQQPRINLTFRNIKD